MSRKSLNVAGIFKHASTYRNSWVSVHRRGRHTHTHPRVNRTDRWEWAKQRVAGTEIKDVYLIVWGEISKWNSGVCACRHVPGPANGWLCM